MILIIVSFGAVAILATYAVIQGEKEKKVKKQYSSLWRNKSSKEIREVFQTEKQKDTPNKVLLKILNEKADKRDQLEKIQNFNYGTAATNTINGIWKIVVAIFYSLIPAIKWTVVVGLIAFVLGQFTSIVFVTFQGVAILFIIIFIYWFFVNILRVIED
jgi:Flp pilus assembly protein TadB